MKDETTGDRFRIEKENKFQVKSNQDKLLRLRYASASDFTLYILLVDDFFFLVSLIPSVDRSASEFSSCAFRAQGRVATSPA